MKVVILAGGLGTRLSEETVVKPKPMVEIGDKPIIWHIMKIFSHYGFNDFIICLGYKGYFIKEWFCDYSIHNNDLILDLKTNSRQMLNNHSDDWKITLVDTGDMTMTGGRIKRIKDYIGDETFMMTYGDGVSDIDINKLIEYHRTHGKLATVSAVIPEGRFGVLGLDGTMVTHFSEKTDNQTRINGGFFVLEPKIFDYIDGDDTIFEKGPLEALADEGELMGYYHDGFWKPMDKLNDKKALEEMWQSGKAPWAVWQKETGKTAIAKKVINLNSNIDKPRW